MNDNLLYNSKSNIGTEGGGEGKGGVGKGIKYSRRPNACCIVRTSPVPLPLCASLSFSKPIRATSLSPSPLPGTGLAVLNIPLTCCAFPSEFSAKVCLYTDGF